MAQAERVAYLVRGHKADELAHQFVVVLHLLCGFVQCASLHEVPVVEERHHVVVPTDVAFQNLACAGVVNVRSVGVFYVRGQVAYARVARILH